MKKVWLLAIALLSFATSCSRDRFYTCICNTSGQQAPVQPFKLGRMSQEQAIQQCRTKVNGRITECHLELRK
jgi:hypothetical protein